MSSAFAQIAPAATATAESISESFMPATVWVFLAAMCLSLVLIAVVMYFWYLNRVRAVVGDNKTAADLAAQVEYYQAKIDQQIRWLDENNQELLKKDAERMAQEEQRQKLLSLEQEISRLQESREVIAREMGEIEGARFAALAERDRLQSQYDQLQVQIAEAQRAVQESEAIRQAVETARQEHASLTRECDLARQRHQEILNEMADRQMKSEALARQIERLDREMEQMKVDGVRLSSEIQQKRAEADKLQEGILAAEREFVKVEEKLTSAEKRLHEIAQAVSENERRRNTLQFEIDTVTKLVSDLRHERDQLKSEKEGEAAKLEKLRLEVPLAQKALQECVEKRMSEERRFHDLLDKVAEQKITSDRLNQEIAVVKKELQALQDANGNGPETPDRYADLINEGPFCLSDDCFPEGALTKVGEEEMLWRIQEKLRSEGIYFSERTLNAFHTSLKVSDITPLTVLAGVSGTGKSLLPVKYAELMGIHSLIVSVQPRWDSPQDLFGFYNYLEHKYKATDLARALVCMDEFNFSPRQFPTLAEHKRSDRMLLVLLDEMNLARTEYYFSEFLSKLEFRKLVHGAANRDRAEIVLETGPRSKESQLFRLWVGGNVHFVGTMNEDESTQTLSDKVLDRANVLRFGKPPENAPRQEGRNAPGTEKRCYLTFSQWKSWLREPGSEPWRAAVEPLLSQLNDALNRLGRPFGYRVRDAILAYITNYPGLNHNGNIYKTALADQVELKLLPKLRGVEVSENMETLNLIQDVIIGLGDDLLLEQFRNCRQQAQNTTNLFAWRGVERPV
jgi:predicted  nucleic acid-binding Zn-ribbon protein